MVVLVTLRRSRNFLSREWFYEEQRSADLAFEDLSADLSICEIVIFKRCGTESFVSEKQHTSPQAHSHQTATMGSIEEEQTPISIPIIDFAKWSSGGTAEQRFAVAKELSEACHKVGFVFIINHGVSPELLEEAFGWSKRLFDLKTEEKMLAPHPDGHAVHRGYSWPGLEKVSQVISEDLEVGEKLRAVTDCKVYVPSSVIGKILTIVQNRKAMKSAVKIMTNNPTSGSPKKSSPASANS